MRIIEPTHETFEEMAAAIFAADDADPDFPGIVPWDNPASLVTGYIKAAPRSKRTYEDQWCIRIDVVKRTELQPETVERLGKLVERARRS